MADGENKGSKKPRPDWYKVPKSCRAGGPAGAYEHLSECIWKDCCARFQMNFPEQGNIRSCRGIVQANTMEITFPKRR